MFDEGAGGEGEGNVGSGGVRECEICGWGRDGEAEGFAGVQERGIEGAGGFGEGGRGLRAFGRGTEVLDRGMESGD
jgi:hypothetical protein